MLTPHKFREIINNKSDPINIFTINFKNFNDPMQKHRNTSEKNGDPILI